MSLRSLCATALLLGVAGSWSPGVQAQSAETSAGRFVANGDEVTDTLTGLVWRRCLEGQRWTGSTCEGRPSTFAWFLALYHAKMVAADGTPWRLPNVKELGSLVDDTRVSPAIDKAAFPRTYKAWNWSSTHLGGHVCCAWVVDFDTGMIGAPSRRYEVPIRLVRSAP